VPRAVAPPPALLPLSVQTQQGLAGEGRLPGTVAAQWPKVPPEGAWARKSRSHHGGLVQNVAPRPPTRPPPRGRGREAPPTHRRRHRSRRQVQVQRPHPVQCLRLRRSRCPWCWRAQRGALLSRAHPAPLRTRRRACQGGQHPRWRVPRCQWAPSRRWHPALPPVPARAHRVPWRWRLVPLRARRSWVLAVGARWQMAVAEPRRGEGP